MRPPTWLRQHIAALRVLLVFTVILGLVYPLVLTGVVQLPGLRDNANGSVVESDGRVAGSRLIGQNFTDELGNPLLQYLQPRPSAAGDGYDPTSSTASNLGPEDVVDKLPDPKLVKAGKEDPNARQSLLTLVCSRSRAIGELEGVSGARPFCTQDGVGAVLAVFGPRSGPTSTVAHVQRAVSVDQECPAKPFIATYRGVRVACAEYGVDYSAGQIVPVRGDAPAHPRVPSDAVTASGSGLDPQISPAYARLQAPRVARVRGISESQVLALVRRYTTGRSMGFMGEPGVNVLQVDLALDREYPYRG
jgi:potassium-transporting ATPase KdpC subunit